MRCFFRASTPAALLVSLCFTSALQAKSEVITSPDGHIEVQVSDEQGMPSYQLSYRGEVLIENSPLGILFAKAPALANGFVLTSTEKNTVDETWTQPWGERKYVRDNHKEMKVNWARTGKSSTQFSVRFRVFDDGIGFRYEVPKQKGFNKLAVTDELTEFRIAGAENVTAWWIPSRGWNRYEYNYNTTPLNKVDRAHTPFTFKTGSGVHLSIHEAALVDYAAMTLDQQRDGTLKADLTPWSDGIRAKVEGAFSTPWRTVQVSPDAKGLLNSDLILNLNEPNTLGDVSWVKPGKYLGIWWGMHLGENTWGTSDTHGATTSETKRYMDFAAKYGFDGVLVEGWNEGWDGDWYRNGDVFSFTQPYKDFDLAAVSEYGKQKGVRLIGHHETSGSVTNYRNQVADAFELYQEMGVRQVKTGYVADGGKIKRVDKKGVSHHEWHDGQFMVGEYLHSVKEAAKRQISINTHEPIKDTGLRRTYPNWIAREGARGQEYNAWGTPPNTPEHTALLPYTRMLSGPMDFTPGIFDLGFDGLDAVNRVKTTLAKQLSLYVVLYSPIQMAADLPTNYEAKLPAFQFIRDVPTDWQDSRALAGEVGDYVVFARQGRDSDDWFVGALSDEDARAIEFSTDFLDEDRVYEAQIYRDGENADWLKNPYDLVIETRKVKRGAMLSFKLAKSGGLAIRFKALTH